MIEVSLNLFVGDDTDEEKLLGQEGWAMVHACKEPCHRRALDYSGRGAPRDNPGYLVVDRGDHLYLNLVDYNVTSAFTYYLVGYAQGWIYRKLWDPFVPRRVLVHCNMGESRAPTIALCYLWGQGELPRGGAVAEFRRRYPRYNPAGAMAEVVLKVVGEEVPDMERLADDQQGQSE